MFLSFLTKLKKIEISKFLDNNKIIFTVFTIPLELFLFVIRISCKIFSYNSGNIVIVSLNKLGDSVFTIPAIIEIQKKYQNKIFIFCFAESVPVYKLALKNISYCIVNHREFYFNNRISSNKANKLLRTLKPEIVFDFSNTMTSATLLFNIRAKKIIGTNRTQFRNIYDYFIPMRNSSHLMDNYLDIIEPVVPLLDRRQIKIFPKKSSSDGIILIHPFAGWKSKEWNFTKFIKLVKILYESYDVSLIFPGNINIPKDVYEEIISDGIKCIETIRMEDLIENIKKCSALIGNDSGPIHIANLLGKPTFTIYGPTNPDIHIPIGSHHSYTALKINCSPIENEKVCITNAGRFGCPSFECMSQQSWENVLLKIQTFLKENRISNKILIN